VRAALLADFDLWLLGLDTLKDFHGSIGVATTFKAAAAAEKTAAADTVEIVCGRCTLTAAAAHPALQPFLRQKAPPPPR
jgi:hypothetical protein